MYPYCSYPYTFVDKSKYYGLKTISKMIRYSGVLIFNKYFAANIALDDKYLETLEKSELTDIINVTRSIQYIYLKKVFLGSAIIVSGLFLRNFYCILFTPPYGKYTLGILLGSISATVINLNNFLTTTYNKCISQNVSDEINHITRVTRASLAISEEMSSISRSQPTHSILKSAISKQIYLKKISWFMISDPLSYIICNAYYEHLFFAFDLKDTADKFLQNVKKLELSRIEYYANYPMEAERYQMDFIGNTIKQRLLKLHLIENY